MCQKPVFPFCRFYDYFGWKHYIDTFFFDFFMSIIILDPSKNVLKPFLGVLSSGPIWPYFQPPLLRKIKKFLLKMAISRAQMVKMTFLGAQSKA